MTCPVSKIHWSVEPAILPRIMRNRRGKGHAGLLVSMLGISSQAEPTILHCPAAPNKGCHEFWMNISFFKVELHTFYFPFLVCESPLMLEIIIVLVKTFTAFLLNR